MENGLVSQQRNEQQVIHLHAIIIHLHVLEMVKVRTPAHVMYQKKMETYSARRNVSKIGKPR